MILGYILLLCTGITFLVAEELCRMWSLGKPTPRIPLGSLTHLLK